MIGRRFLRSLATSSLLCATLANAGNENRVIIWHNLDLGQARLLQSMLEPLTNQGSIPILLETGFDLPAALLRVKGDQMPDAVLAPADLTSLHDTLHLSQIPPHLAESRVPNAIVDAVSSEGRPLGIPVFVGNHLMLFYNKRMAPKPPSDFNQISTLYPNTSHPFGWIYREPFFMFPFFAAFAIRNNSDQTPETRCPFARNALANAFAAYRNLEKSGIVSRNCDYDCMTQGFYKGQLPFSISGDWALDEARQNLGDSLGVAPLPKLAGRPVPSYFMPTALFFPNLSLSGRKRPMLEKIAHAVTSISAQKRWLAEGGRLPASRAAIPAEQEMPTPQLRDSYRILKSARPFPRLPNAWFWSALRRSFDLHLDGGKSVQEASRLLWEVCSLDSAPGDPP